MLKETVWGNKYNPESKHRELQELKELELELLLETDSLKSSYKYSI